jgi:hypothetical protein
MGPASNVHREGTMTMIDRKAAWQCARRAIKIISIALIWISAVLWFCSLVGCAPQNEVINYRTYTDPEKGIFYIYDGVLDHAELISGVGAEQARVVITRQN